MLPQRLRGKLVGIRFSPDFPFTGVVKLDRPIALMQNPQSGQIRLTHGLNKPSENFVGKLVGRAALWGH
ncbi:Uncharacterized protein HZ326_1215 [Fusarium oxysporum f. sp. albedinis]|nr:Uncharacterized protein HZ326_1215 [Fusarium oxysporum f. sp. albedinis]